MAGGDEVDMHEIMKQGERRITGDERDFGHRVPQGGPSGEREEMVEEFRSRDQSGDSFVSLSQSMMKVDL